MHDLILQSSANDIDDKNTVSDSLIPTLIPRSSGDGSTFSVDKTEEMTLESNDFDTNIDWVSDIVREGKEKKKEVSTWL